MSVYVKFQKTLRWKAEVVHETAPSLVTKLIFGMAYNDREFSKTQSTTSLKFSFQLDQILRCKPVYTYTFKNFAHPYPLSKLIIWTETL